MKILAIDPGPTYSALLGYDSTAKVIGYRYFLSNFDAMRAIVADNWSPKPDVLVVEKVVNMNQFLGEDLLATIVWSGRFRQAWYQARSPNDRAGEIDRRRIKMFLLGTVKGTDADIRAALIDRWGGKDKALGAVKCPICRGRGKVGPPRGPKTDCPPWQIPPGPLHGLAGHDWAALAVAVTWAETNPAGAGPEPAA